MTDQLNPYDQHILQELKTSGEQAQGIQDLARIANTPDGQSIIQQYNLDRQNNPAIAQFPDLAITNGQLFVDGHSTPTPPPGPNENSQPQGEKPPMQQTPIPGQEHTPAPGPTLAPRPGG